METDDIFDDPAFWDLVDQSSKSQKIPGPQNFNNSTSSQSSNPKHVRNASADVYEQKFRCSKDSWKVGLNNEQRQAVESDPERPLLVLAGAGSGKTLTMCKRIRHILESTGCKPWEILAITFTRNAAQEMKERLSKEMGAWAGSRLKICTFHSFCLKLCREHAEHAGYLPNFTIYSGREQYNMISEALSRGDRDRGKDTNSPNYRADLRERSKSCLKRILRMKADGKGSDDAKGDLQEIFRFYEREMLAQNAMDFSDLVNKAIQILMSQDDILKSYQEKLKYILVDEFQDTSQLQYQLITMIGAHCRVTAVGDDDQSIYSFQGAYVGNFELFQKEFTRYGPVNLIRLQQNYRSTSTIVDASNAVIKLNKARVDKTCWTSKGEGPKVTVVECRTKKCELAFLLDEIIRREIEGQELKEMAILYRRNCVGSGEVIPALKAKGVPYTTNHMYKANEISNVIAFLRLAINLKDNNASRRVIHALKLKLKQEVIDCIEQKLCKGVSVVEAIQALELEIDQTNGPLQSLDSKARKQQKKELAKFSHSIHVMQSRMGELSLIEFIKRVLELCPNIRAQMNQVSTKCDGTQQRRSLGQALINEAEDFLERSSDPSGFSDEQNRDPNQYYSCGGMNRQVSTNYEERQKEACARVKDFLDHISMSLEEEQEFRKSKRNQGPSKKRRRKVVRPGDKRLKWGRFTSEEEEEEVERDAVWVGTVHQAKGLEWPTVFVVRMNEEEFPLHTSKGDGQMKEENLVFEEEERRLGYVALSRAEEHLFLSYILEESGGNMAPKKSRFIRDIPSHLTRHVAKYDVLVACSDRLDSTQVGDSALVSTQSEWRQFVANPERCGSGPKRPYFSGPKKQTVSGNTQGTSKAGHGKAMGLNSDSTVPEYCVSPKNNQKGHTQSSFHASSIKKVQLTCHKEDGKSSFQTEHGVLKNTIQSRATAKKSTQQLSQSQSFGTYSVQQNNPQCLQVKKEKPKRGLSSHIDQFLLLQQQEDQRTGSRTDENTNIKEHTNDDDDFLPKKRRRRKKKKIKTEVDTF